MHAIRVTWPLAIVALWANSCACGGEAPLACRIDDLVGDASALQFCPPRNVLAYGGEKGVLRFATMPDGKPSGTHVAVGGWIRAVEVSPSGRTLAARSIVTIPLSNRYRHTVQIFDMPSGKRLASYGNLDLGNLSPDGKLLVLKPAEKDVELYDVTAGAVPKRIGALPDSSELFFAQVSPDRKTLAAVTLNNTLLIWDLGKRTVHRTLLEGWPDYRRAPPAPAAPGSVWSRREVRVGWQHLAYRPDGKVLAAAGEYETGHGDAYQVRFWATDTWQEIGYFRFEGRPDLNGVAFSADGKLLAIGGSGGLIDNSRGKEAGPKGRWSVALIDMATHEMRASTHAGGRAGQVDFSPDGKHLATTVQDEGIRVWEVAELLKHGMTGYEPPPKPPRVKPVANREEAIAELQRLHTAFEPEGKEGPPLSLVDPEGAHFALLAYLPELESLKIYSADLDERSVKHLRGLKRLRKLNLDGIGKLGPLPAALADMTQLEELEVTRAAMSGKTAHLRGLKRLRRLVIAQCSLTNADLEPIAAIGQLEELGLQGNEGISGVGLRRLQGLKHLETLDLSDNLKFTGVGIANLAKLPRLEELNLQETGIDEEGLAELSRLTNLRWVNLSATPIDDAALERLRPMTQLQGLSLRETKVTDAGLAHLGGLTGLESLLLGSTEINGAGLSHLARLKRLRDLDMAGTRLDDAGAKHLEALTGLERLNLDHTRITDGTVQHLRKLTRLQELSLSYKMSRSAKRDLLGALPKLRSGLSPDFGSRRSQGRGEKPDGAKGGK